MSSTRVSLIERDEPATGVRSTDRPGWWVVPPWPDNAGAHEIVRHFPRFNPLGGRYSDADSNAYHVGYLRALDTASTDDLTCDVAWAWYRELRQCVAECVEDDLVAATAGQVAPEAEAALRRVS